MSAIEVGEKKEVEGGKEDDRGVRVRGRDWQTK